MLANFCAQAILRVPFSSPLPTLKMIDFQIVLVLDVRKSVELPRLTESFGKFYALILFGNIFQL